MLRLFRGLLRRLPLVLSLIAICFAIDRWLWLQSLPRHSPARFCWNCRPADVDIVIELGLCGAVIVLASLFHVPWRRSDIPNWCIVGIGIASKPLIIGHLIFALGLFILVCEKLFTLVYEKLLPCSTAAASSAQPPAPR